MICFPALGLEKLHEGKRELNLFFHYDWFLTKHFAASFGLTIVCPH
jgi:hypothetical protein